MKYQDNDLTVTQVRSQSLRLITIFLIDSILELNHSCQIIFVLFFLSSPLNLNPIFL